jgi:hypothetical protein
LANIKDRWGESGGRVQAGCFGIMLALMVAQAVKSSLDARHSLALMC